MEKTKKILITGSSGTIGTRLFESLLEQGYEVVGFDKKPNIWHKNLDSLTIKGDLTVRESMNEIPKDVDMIIHLAANARVYDSVVNPDLALENILMTFSILEFARKADIKKFIFSSSREIYGNRDKNKFVETDADFYFCEGPYASSKITGESLFLAYRRCYKIDSVILRLSNVYGMYDQSERFIPKMIEQMLEDRDVSIYGKEKFLDFTYIDDCVSGIIKCIEKFSDAKNNTFNIATGSGSKLIDVAQMLKGNLKSKSKIIIQESRTSEVLRYEADISKAGKILNYTAKTLVKDGLISAIDWYIKNRR